MLESWILYRLLPQCHAWISAKLGMVPQSSLALLLLLWETRLIGRVTHAGGDGELKPPGKKKFITRDEEPEQ